MTEDTFERVLRYILERALQAPELRAVMRDIEQEVIFGRDLAPGEYSFEGLRGVALGDEEK